MKGNDIISSGSGPTERVEIISNWGKGKNLRQTIWGSGGKYFEGNVALAYG